jgi:3-deoxy-D-manno-octulosonic-acid transferase
MSHTLYRLLTGLGGPLIALYLARRRRLGKEDPLRFAERQGRPGAARPPGPLVWIHAASVGESLSVLPLIAALRDGGLGVLLTTGTRSSAALMAERLPAGAIHQFVPVDRVGWVRRFLDHWRPDLGLMVESDLWPNLLAECRARRIPLALIQGRMSPRSAKGWRRAPGLISAMLQGFALILAQTEADAERLRGLGGVDVRALGNLKHAAPPLPAEPEALRALGAALAGRPLWLAASTHPGEEEIAAQVQTRLAGRFPGLLTLIVPRHPERGAEIAGALAAEGHVVARRALGEIPDAATTIYLADSMGELGLFYRLADIVFVGKSLRVGGGQNPVEPARLGAALLLGPLMDNFPEMAAALIACGAARPVADETALEEAVAALLADPAETARMKDAAHAWAEAEAGGLDAALAALSPLLPPADTAR